MIPFERVGKCGIDETQSNEGRKLTKEQKASTKEFKIEAVRLAETSGKPVTEIARDLGRSDSTIHTWRKPFSEHGEQAFPGSGHQRAEAEELRRLKRELEVGKQERDSLKKALHIFSRQ